MENKDLITDFLVENKKEIDDNGFSRKVRNRLPETRDRQWIVLIMAVLGTSLTLMLGFYTGLFAFICDFLKHVSPFVILGAVVAFPLLLMPIIFTQKYGFAKNTWY
jgi:hypothetical protein